MGTRVSIVVEVPQGRYCATFGEHGLEDRCPLLQECRASGATQAFYCPIANFDCHCGQDSIGILKQDDYYDQICPSLYQEKIMKLLRQKAGTSS